MTTCFAARLTHTVGRTTLMAFAHKSLSTTILKEANYGETLRSP